MVTVVDCRPTRHPAQRAHSAKFHMPLEVAATPSKLTGHGAKGGDVVLRVQQIPKPLGAQSREGILDLDGATQLLHILACVHTLHVRPAVRGSAVGGHVDDDERDEERSEGLQERVGTRASAGFGALTLKYATNARRARKGFMGGGSVWIQCSFPRQAVSSRPTAERSPVPPV